MKTLKFISVFIFAIVMAMSFTACSDDDDEGGNVSALKGNDLWLSNYKDYKDGEVVNKGYLGMEIYETGWMSYLSNSNYPNAIYAKWALSGSTATISYMDHDYEVIGNETYKVQNVYDFGYFVLRQEVNSSTVDYRLVVGGIDSDDYDDKEIPEWFYEEWNY